MVQQTHTVETALQNGRGDFLPKVVRMSWGVLILAIVYQLIFFADITNITAMAAVTFAWIITTRIWLRKKMLESYMFSSFIILGFVATQFYLPLLFTTIEHKPLVYNLELPEEVFLHSTAGLLVLVLAHAFYRFLMSATPNRSFSLLDKAGFFTPPTHLQLWIMGALGMVSSIYVYFTAPEVGQAVTGAASDKLVQALVPFTYAPFFIPLSKLYGNSQKPHRGFLLCIVLFTMLLLAISIGRNSRGGFIVGLTNPAFAYALGLLIGVFHTRIFTVKNFVVGGLVIWFLTGPLSDLGTAMLNVRGTRTEISAMELITLTFEALDDKEAIKARKASDISELMDMDWDEHYLDNIYTARFANIKFNDSNLVTYSKVGQYDPDMQDFSLDFLIAQFPDPLIRKFNFDIDKELVLSVSFGDYLYVLSGGYGTPGAFRVGHFAGTGMAAYGWWYLLLLAAVVIPIFYLNDKLFRAKGTLRQQGGATNERFCLSFCGVLALTSFFQFLVLESVIQGATYIVRGWLQMVLLYFLIFHASRLMGVVIMGKKKKVLFTPN